MLELCIVRIIFQKGDIYRVLALNMVLVSQFQGFFYNMQLADPLLMLLGHQQGQAWLQGYTR